MHKETTSSRLLKYKVREYIFFISKGRCKPLNLGWYNNMTGESMDGKEEN